MRHQQYSYMLSMCLQPKEAMNLLGPEKVKELSGYLAIGDDRLCILKADYDFKGGYDMIMSSRLVTEKVGNYDVIVYGLDGPAPFKRGNYFRHDGIGYLAFGGTHTIDSEDYNNLPQLRSVIHKNNYAIMENVR